MSNQHHYHRQQQHQQHLHNQQQQFQTSTSTRGASATTSKSHYSNRQQVSTSGVAGQVSATGGGKQLLSAPASSNSSQASELDSHALHLGSLSTQTKLSSSSSSQAAMLASHKSSSQLQREHMMREQAAAHRQQQQHRAQQQQLHVAAAHHRQPLGPLGTGPKGAAAAAAAQQKAHLNSAGDNLTTSSSSDHTIDDLHQLAHGYSSSRRRLHHPSSAATTAATIAAMGAGATSGADGQAGGRFLLGVLFTLAELLLFATVLLWLYWAYQHDDGLAWQQDRKQQFNTHAALMLVGFVFLTGQAMLIYRSFQCCTKIYTKILHTILFVLATSAISLGLILAYTAQENVGPNNKPIMHFYSLHAWCGLTTIGLFVLQFVFGFVSFLILLCCDQATSNYRAALLPIHRTFGLIIFTLAIATSLMGLLQTARSRLR